MKCFRRIILIGWISSLWSELVSNWTTLTSSPSVFIASLALGFTLAFITIKWIYQEKLNTLSEQIKLAQDRIRFKDESIDRAESRLVDFREALRLEEPRSAYQLLTKQELKDRTLNATNELRGFIVKWSVKYKDQYKEDPNTARLTPDCHLMQEFSSLRYSSKFSSLRDELHKRLPEQYWFSAENNYKEECKWAYISPSWFSGLSFIVSDLERLAENLDV